MARTSSRRTSSPAPVRRPPPAVAARPAAAPAPAPAQAMPTQPVPQAAAAPPMVHHAPPTAVASQGPGLLTQIAANAASVAAGSVIAHTVMDAMRGSGDKAAPAAAAPAAPAPAPMYSAPQTQSNPCSYELEQFLGCTQRFSHDLGTCSGFNDQLKQCKLNFGLQ